MKHEEEMWKTKSRIQWLTTTDLNTNFFIYPQLLGDVEMILTCWKMLRDTGIRIGEKLKIYWWTTSSPCTRPPILR